MTCLKRQHYSRAEVRLKPGLSRPKCKPPSPRVQCPLKGRAPRSQARERGPWGSPAAPRKSTQAGILPCSEHPRHSPCTHLSSLTVVSRPVILDPADPTGNVAGGDPQRWQLLAQEVKVWLKYSCCKKLSGKPVGTWKVPVRTPDFFM